jgi:hypothetical protein
MSLKKLTPEQRRMMIQERHAGEKLYVLSRKYGVNESTISTQHSRWLRKATHEQAQACLNFLPEVKWDRFAGDSTEQMTAFGWIPRWDGRYDFVVLTIEAGTVVRMITSSAKYSSKFAARFGLPVHGDCKRIADHFRGVKNKSPKWLGDR